MRRRVYDEGGQALVEFALVVPLVLLLLFGMIQFALVLNARQTVAYAAQAAANGYAQTLVRKDATALAASAAAQMRPEFSKAGILAFSLISGAGETRIVSDATGTFGDFVAARATYDYPSPIQARLGPFQFPRSFQLSVEAVARIEAAGSAGTAGSASGPTSRQTPRPTPTPTPRPAAAPGPTAAPAPIAAPGTRTPVAASCFAYDGTSLGLPGATGPVLIDGGTSPRSFSPGSTHFISASYTIETTRQETRRVRVGLRRSRTEVVTVREPSVRQVTGQFTVPSSGVVGTVYPAVASFGGAGNARVQLKGTAGVC